MTQALAVPNFAITAKPSAVSVVQGNQGTSTISTTISGGFNSAITLSASGVPTGTTVSFNPNPIRRRLGQLDDDHHGGSSTPPGTYPITVTGNGGGIRQHHGDPDGDRACSQLHDFSLAQQLMIGQGNQGTSTITTTISGGLNSAISLSASGVPSGTTVVSIPTRFRRRARATRR